MLFNSNYAGNNKNLPGVEVARCLLRSSHTGLDLSANCIRDAGAEALAAAVRCNKNLTALVLRSNDIGPHGGAALLNAIARNHCITMVDLSGISGVNRNHIGTKGCRALCEVLHSNPCLVSLNVDENGFGPIGVEQFAPGVLCAACCCDCVNAHVWISH